MNTPAKPTMVDDHARDFFEDAPIVNWAAEDALVFSYDAGDPGPPDTISHKAASRPRPVQPNALTTLDHERKRRAADERARKAVRRAKGMKRG